MQYYATLIIVIFLLAQPAKAQDQYTRVEIGGQFSTVRQSGSSGSAINYYGYGWRFDWNFNRRFAFESQVDFFPQDATRRFLTQGGQLYYVPHSYTGIIVSLLFLGRLVYRIAQIYGVAHPSPAAGAVAANAYASAGRLDQAIAEYRTALKLRIVSPDRTRANHHCIGECPHTMAMQQVGFARDPA